LSRHTLAKLADRERSVDEEDVDKEITGRLWAVVRCSDWLSCVMRVMAPVMWPVIRVGVLQIPA